MQQEMEIKDGIFLLLKLFNEFIWKNLDLYKHQVWVFYFIRFS